MDKVLRALKRQVASKPLPQMTNEVTLCAPHAPTNPYREASTKYAKWEALCAFIHTRASTTTVHDILQHTNYTASELWKEARLGHLNVVLMWPDESVSVSMMTCLDNVRAQWSELRVMCGVSKDTLFVIQKEQQPQLTLHDICARVEQSSDVWQPTHDNAVEWSFLLQSSNRHDILNSLAHVHSKWWSSERFGHAVHRFTTVVHIEVFPCLFGPDVQEEMGLCGNRSVPLQHTQPQVVPPPSVAQAHVDDSYKQLHHLREEQDDAYYASLKADQAKKKEADQAEKKEADQAKKKEPSPDEDNATPLTTKQLREARCRFFQSFNG